jgi:excisionase family DNA binding protein
VSEAKAAAVQRWLTPPQLAAMLGVEPPKVIGWINRGELRAVNVADKKGKRPRWRISPEAFEDFIKPRTSAAPVKPTRRKRYADFEIFFPPSSAL